MWIAFCDFSLSIVLNNVKICIIIFITIIILFEQIMSSASNDCHPAPRLAVTVVLIETPQTALGIIKVI